MTGSNRRPPACKAGALPAELILRNGMLFSLREKTWLFSLREKTWLFSLREKTW